MKVQVAGQYRLLGLMAPASQESGLSSPSYPDAEDCSEVVALREDCWAPLAPCSRLPKITKVSESVEFIMSLIHPSSLFSLIECLFFDFANNKISFIRKEAFQSLPELSTVRLHINKLTELPQQLFDGSRNVKKMELQRNRFTSFDVSILNSLNKLLKKTRNRPDFRKFLIDFVYLNTNK